MTRNRLALFVCVFVLFCSIGPPSWAAEQNVTAYLTKKVSVFEQRGKSFKRIAKRSQNEMPSLPAAVLEASSKGFVKIKTANGLVWLDTMDVKVVPPKTSGKSTKKHGVSSSSKKKGFHTRGIGE